MPDEYTPTTEEVRDGYRRARYYLDYQQEDADRHRSGAGEFDRWLAQHDAEVAATTVDATAMKEGYGGPLQSKPGHYLGSRGSRWELDSDGQWWFRGYSDRPHPTPDQQDRTENDVRMYGMPLSEVEK